ncbi:ferredoxin--NADP reductase [Sabulicella rubraurantiaca]|uniref:ferredoxin--NADP reductase n=1 Tax=Sabulicella rubraurantiaca TaxID=2811429 RepID=UPI001A958488|nr:ferredoxin--NADP reductase [Sabulicella rubraurantiaca]
MDIAYDPIAAAPPGFFAEEVTSVHHWTGSLFSFTCTRDPALRFTSGQFAMIGLVVNGKPLVRAYSMVSPAWEGHLEFLSIKVQDGPLTSRLQHIQVGEKVLIGRKPVGTLIPDNLLPGRNLWFLATGTGIAPFMSLIRDPEVYERYDRIILAHTVREVKELAYRDYITGELRDHELLGDFVREKLVYLPAVTREPFPVQGRITARLETGAAEREAGVETLDPAQDRVMICGSEAMNADCKALLEARGFVEGNNSEPGTFVVEKAFVTK